MTEPLTLALGAVVTLATSLAGVKAVQFVYRRRNGSEHRFSPTLELGEFVDKRVDAKTDRLVQGLEHVTERLDGIAADVQYIKGQMSR